MEKKNIAHSLGNMVVCSAIQDHGMNVDKYFMLNAAVPAEAFAPGEADESANNPLVHEDWTEYNSITWSTKWHTLFENDDSDSRKKLTWMGRFKYVAPRAYNFYSSGDEVFELYKKGVPDYVEGLGNSLTKGRYSWHKQEVYKGGHDDALSPGTSWSGWGFATKVVSRPSLSEDGLEEVPKYTASEANGLNRDHLRTNTVFKLYPTSMNSPTLTRLELDEHLAKGIPALSKAVGICDAGFGDNSFNLTDNADFQPNKYWREKNLPNSKQKNRWLHSDFVNVSYYYVYKLFEKFVDEGKLE